MKIINKKIISSFLIIALVLSSNGLNVLANQNNTFDEKETTKEQIVINYDEEELQEKTNISIDPLIREEENKEEQLKESYRFEKNDQEQEEDNLLSISSEIEKTIDDNSTISTNSFAINIDDEQREATKSVIFGTKASESDTTKIKKNYGHLDPGVKVPIAKVNKSNTFGLPLLPSSYDSRNETNSSGMSIVPPVRNQYPHGTCWAHSTIGMIETSIRKQDLVDNEEDSNLSEAALAYFVYNLETVTDTSNVPAPAVAGRDFQRINIGMTTEDWAEIGSNPMVATLMMSSYLGAVKENEDTKYSKVDDMKLNGLDGKYAYKNNDFEIVDAQWINKNNLDLVKQAIMENGSAGIGYFEDRDATNCHKSGTEWYYYPTANRTNHDVMIVGWDDNISKDLFYNTDGEKPNNNGGWLVRNSWGDDNDCANHGYFWISYEDQTLGDEIYSIKATKSNTYKYNYHYDSTGVAYYRNLNQNWGAGNIFQTSNDNDQVLEAVNVSFLTPNSDFSIEVYTNDNKMNDPIDGTKQLSQNVYKETAGVFTIALDKQIILKKNSYFSIIIKNNSSNIISIIQDGLDLTRKVVVDGKEVEEEREIQRFNEAKLDQSFVCLLDYDYCVDDNRDQTTHQSTLVNINGIDYGRNYRIKALTNIFNDPTPTEYTLNYGWYDATKAGKNENEITKITILKNPSAIPTGADANWEITGSGGLQCYRKGTEVIIYAPEDKPIYAPEDSSYLFAAKQYDNLMSNYNTDYTKCFVKCESIENLNYLDTSRVTDMTAMFHCVGMLNVYGDEIMANGYPQNINDITTNPKKTIIDITSFDTSNVTNMSRMFELSAIEDIDVSNLDTNKVTNMKAMFAQAALLTTIDISSLNMKNVTNANSMFTLCLSLKDINMIGLSFDNASDFETMFNQCPELTTIYASSTFYINPSASTIGMFNQCPKLKGERNTGTTGNPTDATYARLDTVATPGYFSSVPLKEYILAPSWYDETQAGKEKDKITSITILKAPISAPTNVDNSWNIQGSNGLIGYIKGTEVTIYAPQEGNINMAEDSSYLFSDINVTSTGFSNLEYINNLDYLITDNVTNMKGMFKTCQNLNTLDLSNFNTSNVTDMSEMFYFCRSLTIADVSNFNTSKVTDFANMFFCCYYLGNIDVSDFDTSNATNMSGMFNGCKSVTILDTSRFNTSKVTSMMWMFGDCINLASIDLSNFDTSKVTEMSHMFYFTSKNNTALKTLNLSSFNTSEVTTMAQMFYNCSKLETILVSDKFVTTKLTQDKSDLFMFESCTSLKGGNNTVFDENHIDKLYARIDGASGLSGYFTGNEYFDVGFDMKGHGIQIPTQSVVKKGKVTKPVDPTETGFSFKGWYDSDQFTKEFDFNQEITKTTTIYAKWEEVIIYYNVSFEMNKHGTQISPQSIKENETAIKPVDPTETGYEFKGWYDTDQLINEFDFTKGIVKETTIYAKWKENEYNITYNKNGGDWKTGGQHKATRSYTESLNLPTSQDIEKVIGTDVYEFAGWWTQDGTTSGNWGTQVITIVANTNSDIEVFAKWKSTVSFNANGHGTAPASVEITGSTQVKLQALVADGYIFGGWYDGENWSTSNKVGDKDETITFTGPKILYAKWTPITYTITYNTNEGTLPSGTDPSFTKTYGEPRALASPSKTGYKFAGWFKDNSTFNNKYLGDTDLTTTQGDTKEIYAKWTPIKYNIIYSIPNDIAATAPAQYEKTYKGNYTPANPTNIPTGYRFVSWHTASPYTDANKYTGNTDLSTTENDDITIYSKWELLFSYDANEHGTAPTNEWIEYQKDVTIASPTETTGGFSFDGWFSEKTGGVSYGAIGSSYTVNAPVTAYAHWTENSFDIIYHNINASDYKSGYTAPTSRKYTETKTLPTADNVSRVGYDFDGWYENDGLTGNKIIQTPANFAGKKEYWLKWNEKTYNITLNDNGGKYVDGYQVPNTRKYTESKVLPTNNDIKKTGHTLIGWFPHSDYSGTQATEVAANQDAHFTFYAKWAPSEYKVTLHTNGGTINADDVTKYTYGKGATLPTNVTKANCVFKGWWTLDGSVTGNWGQEVTSITTTDTEDKEFYAKWVESFVVTFKLDGKGTDFTQNVESGQKATRPTDPTYADFEFINWYKDNTYSVLYDFNSAITQAGVEIWAKWQPAITYDVSFDVTNGGVDIGASTPDIQHIKAGQKAIRPANPTTKGYTFEDWYSDSTYQNIYFFNEGITAPKILYGKWRENKYKINYIVNEGIWDQGTTIVTERKYTETTTLLTTISKKYHSFGGWYESSTYEGTAITTIPANTDKEVIIYAKWTPDSNTYTITFNSNYNGATKEVVFSNTEDIALRTDLFTRDGYTFSHWRDEDNNKYDTSDVALSGSILYAEWIQNTPPPSPSNERDSWSTGTSGNGSTGNGAISQAQAQVNQQQSQSQNTETHKVDNYQIHTEMIKGESFVFDPTTNKMKISNQSLKAGFYNIDTGTGGAMYCIDEKGNMKTGLVEYQGNYYYMDERQANLGRMFVGEVMIGNFKFVFDSSGKCISGKENLQQALALQQAQRQAQQQAQQAVQNSQQQAITNQQQSQANIVQQMAQAAQAAQQMAQQQAIQRAMQFAQFSPQNAWNSIINMISTKPFLIQ